MLKNALFLEKAGKIATALGNPSPNTHWPLALLFPLNLHVIFEYCADFLTSSKLKLQLILSYMSDSDLMGPLSQA